MKKLVYQHKQTGIKIELHKITPSLWYAIYDDKRIFYKPKDLKDYKFLKKESVTGGWKTHRDLFMSR